MSAEEEEDIELTDDEIIASKVALRVLIGMMMDMVRNGEGEQAQKLSEDIRDSSGMSDPDADLMQLCFSALRKFGEDPLDEELVQEL